MANATASFAVTDVDKTRRMIIRRGTLTVNAGDYVNDGITLDLSAATNSKFLPYGKFTRTPDFVKILNPPARYQMQIVPGTGLTNWKVIFTQTGTGDDAPFNQLAVSAISSALTGDTQIRVEFLTQVGH